MYRFQRMVSAAGRLVADRRAARRQQACPGALPWACTRAGLPLRRWLRLLPAVLAFAFAGCSTLPPPLVPLAHAGTAAEPAQAGAPAEGALIDVTPVRRIALLNARLQLWLADVRSEPPHAAVDCYRVRYWSTDPHGHPVRASGLLALPADRRLRGVVSYQHGVSTLRGDVPSALNVEGLVAAAVLGGDGFAVVAPDYQGLGDSPPPHPFLHAGAEAADVRGLLEATRAYLPSHLPRYLVGFSQGGHASLSALHVLEREAGEDKEVRAGGGPLAGVVLIAAALNLRTTGLHSALDGTAAHASLFLGYAAVGFAHAYAQPLDSLMPAARATELQRLFDGTHDTSSILAALPTIPRELFDARFLSAWAEDRPHWFLDALAANEVRRWRPRTPVLFLYGERDEMVAPSESLTVANEMRAQGADVEARSVGAVQHADSVRLAIPVLLNWLHAHGATAHDRRSAG